jgi:formylglycine-generating enzyme
VCLYGNVPDEAAAREGLGREIMPCNDGMGLGTASVGSYRPHRLGLQDMTGNVWEWVQDRAGPYSEHPQVDPQGPGSGDERLMRGGSRSGKLHGLQVSHRDGYPPSLAGGAIGFRVALDAP